MMFMPQRSSADPFTNAALVKTKAVRLPSVCSAGDALSRLRSLRADFGLIEANGRFVGLVWTASLATACNTPEGHDSRVSNHADSRAQPVMAWASAAASARRMTRNGTPVVPVLDDSGCAIGVLTLEDFANAFARLQPTRSTADDSVTSMRSARWTM